MGKIKSLLPCGADVQVVAKEALPRIKTLARQNKLKLSLRSFKADDIDGRDLVFCATNDRGLNAEVSKLCQARRIWINAVDQPEFCSFIVPAIVPLGIVTVAISTGGASPAFAKFLRKKMQAAFGSEYGQMAALLKKHRPDLLRIPMSERKKVVKKFLTDEVLSRIKRGSARRAEAELMKLIARQRGA